MNESTNDLYIKVLTIAANEGFPTQIIDDKIAPRYIFEELINAGYLSGQNIKCIGGHQQFNQVKITLPGRQFLEELTNKESKDTPIKPITIINSTVNIGDKNKVNHNSFQNVAITTAPAQTATIKKILIAVISSVIGGLILWYLTH